MRWGGVKNRAWVEVKSRLGNEVGSRINHADANQKFSSMTEHLFICFQWELVIIVR